MSIDFTQTAKVLASLEPDEIKLDHQIKKVLACRPIISRILQGVVSECQEMTPDEVESCISGDVQVEKVPIEPGFTNNFEIIQGLAQEDYIIGEGLITYDVRLTLLLPSEDEKSRKEYIKLLVDLEAQKDDNPGYPIPLRALFYCSRMISSQLGTEFTVSTKDTVKYGNLKKVYSIWICTHSALKRANSIERYSINRSLLYGKNESDDRYDLMEAIRINIGETSKNCDNELIGMLANLLDEKMPADEKIKKLESHYEIPMIENENEEVETMTAYTRNIINNAMTEGMTQGIAQGQRDVIEHALKNGSTPEMIASVNAIPLDEVLDVQKNMLEEAK